MIDSMHLLCEELPVYLRVGGGGRCSSCEFPEVMEVQTPDSVISSDGFFTTPAIAEDPFYPGFTDKVVPDWRDWNAVWEEELFASIRKESFTESFTDKVVLDWRDWFEVWEVVFASKAERRFVLPTLSGKRVPDDIASSLVMVVALANVVPVVPVVLLSFVYLYLIGYIDRDGSKAGSSGSLDFRDIYISIVLFQAAYVWIKFRDVIPLPRGAVYHRRRRDLSKWEPRIKFPGGTGKRLPLGSYDSFAEAEVVYRIAAFYCNKHMHRLGRLNLGGGAYFFIRALSVDLSLLYEEQVNQVGDQVLKVYAEFEEWKASRNLPPHVPGLALETSTGEGELSTTTSPIQQPQEPLNSGMDLAMQGQGSQPAPNIHNGVDFNNSSSGRQELLEAYKEIDNLKAQVSRKEDQINEAYKEIDNLKAQVSRKEDQINEAYKEIDNWKAQVSREEGEYNLRQPELDFDPDTFFDMIEA